jgi:hypothetical protein
MVVVASARAMAAMPAEEESNKKELPCEQLVSLPHLLSEGSAKGRLALFPSTGFIF